MGKDGDPGGQAMSPKDPKLQAAKVRLLDGTHKDFELHRGSDGDALFVLVSADLSIEEREYFSLCFYDTEGTRHWLYNDKKILRQLKGLPWEFCFEVKFYPTVPSSLNDDHARYNLFLQLQNDVCSGRLPATIDTHAALGALAAQAQFGDAKPTPEYEEFLKTTKFAPQGSEQLLQMIAQKHKEHKGLTPAEAENLYMDICKQQTMYGVFVFNAKDNKNVPVGIGISAPGIYIYKEQIRVNRFPWQGIIKISYRKNQFAIKLKAGEIDKKEATVVYKCPDYQHAKRVWKCAVEHHTFFRLIQPDEKPKSSLFRWGSARFRYQGRTQFQTKMASQMFDKPSGVAVQRTNSTRLTHSLDNVAKEHVESGHVSPLHYADNELGSREPMTSPAVTYEVSGQSEKRKLNDKVGRDMSSDDDGDELVYTPVESPSSAAYYLSERSSACSPISTEFNRSSQMRITPLYSWRMPDGTAATSRGQYSYKESGGTYLSPNETSASDNKIQTVERRQEVEHLPINDSVQIYHAGHYNRIDRPQRPHQNLHDPSGQRNGVVSVRRLDPDNEMDRHPIRYFVNVQHSGASHVRHVSRIRHTGREETGPADPSNYTFSMSINAPVQRLEVSNELPAHNVRQYSSVYHPGHTYDTLPNQFEDEYPRVRLIARVVPPEQSQKKVHSITNEKGTVHHFEKPSRKAENKKDEGTTTLKERAESEPWKVAYNSLEAPSHDDQHSGEKEKQHEFAFRPYNTSFGKEAIQDSFESSESFTWRSDSPERVLDRHEKEVEKYKLREARGMHTETAKYEFGSGRTSDLRSPPRSAEKSDQHKQLWDANSLETSSSIEQSRSENTNLLAQKITSKTGGGHRQYVNTEIPLQTSVSPHHELIVRDERSHHRTNLVGRWRQEGDQETVEKDHVRPESYGIASTSYKGPLERTQRTSDLPMATLRDHAKAYHHGQSWDAGNDSKMVTEQSTEGGHKTAVLHLKSTPTKEKPSLATDEETPKVRLIARVPHRTSEEESEKSKPKKEHDTSGLFSFWRTKDKRKGKDLRDGSEHPTLHKYEGPLDNVHRQRDIDQIPFKAPAVVPYKPAGSHEPSSQHRSYLFGRLRHEGDEEVVDKERIRPETYGVATTSYDGPLESTTRRSDLPSTPLREHSKAYHHGQSWDDSKGMKFTVDASDVNRGKAGVVHLKTAAEKDRQSATEEETPKVRLIARVPHTTVEDEEERTKAAKENESQRLLASARSKDSKVTKEPRVYDTQHPSTYKYAGQLDDVHRQKDISQIPLQTSAAAHYKAIVDDEPSHRRTNLFGRWRHEGDEETVEKDRVRPESYGIASTSYKGPLERTQRTSDLPMATLRDHAKAYHHGQSWNAGKDSKIVTEQSTEGGHGKTAVLHLKSTPTKEKPLLANEEETPKVRLIARVPHRTSEEESEKSKPKKEHDTSGLFSFWRTKDKRKGKDLRDGSEHPTLHKYEGPLDNVHRQRDIDQIPFKAPAVVPYKPAGSHEPSSQHRSYLFGRLRHEGDEEVVDKERIRPETYGVATTSYDGPLESTTRRSDLPSTPLREHSKAYHHGQSWDDSKGMKFTVDASDVNRGKAGVVHLKTAAEKDRQSATEEETPKVRLIARVPHTTVEDEEERTKAAKENESQRLLASARSKDSKVTKEPRVYDTQHPSTYKYAGQLDDVHRQKDISQIPLQTSAAAHYKAIVDDEPSHRRTNLFGRWRHEGDEETVEKDRVRPESYGIASTSYKGPLERTQRTSDLPMATLRDHAKAYHHGQSWDAGKDSKMVTEQSTEGGHGKTAVLHLKSTPTKEKPSLATEEETPKVRLIARVPHRTSEEESEKSKPKKEHDTSGLFSFWRTKDKRKGKDLRDGSEHPTLHKYEGPLDNVHRQRDIDQIPFRAPAVVPYKPAGSHEPSSQHRSYLFGRLRHEGDEEVVDKERIRPETYGVATTSYDGPLESTTRRSDLPSTPLREHSKAYHHGQSWDDSKGMKFTVDASDVNRGKAGVVHLKTAAEKDRQSATEEETPKVRLIARVPHTTVEDEEERTKAAKENESQRLLASARSKDSKVTKEPRVDDTQHPSTYKYAGQLDDVHRQKDISQIPLQTSAAAHYKAIVDDEPSHRRTNLFGRWRHEGDEETVEKDRVRPESYGIASTSYKGPLERTQRTSDLPMATLRDHAKAYHHGQSWDAGKDSKMVTEQSTEGGHGKTAVLHLKSTPTKEKPSLATEEETPKVRLIARVPHRTSEEESEKSKPKKEHDTSGLFSFWRTKDKRKGKDLRDGSEHPTLHKYEGPLDNVHRQRDIDQIPFRAPAVVPYKPAGSHEPSSQHRSYLFGRLRHEGDEEVVDKERIRPETYGVATTSYDGPLESTTRRSDLPSTPLREHSKAYHHGQSWDDSKGMKFTVDASDVNRGKAGVVHLKTAAEKDRQSATEEETPKVRLIARVPHTTVEDEEERTKAAKENESQRLLASARSKDSKVTKEPRVDDTQHPSTYKYAGQLDDVHRQKDISQIPLQTSAAAHYKAIVGDETSHRRTNLFGRWRHEGDEETVEKDRVRPESYGIASTSYKGPLERTQRTSDLPMATLRDHAKAYHHGQSWNAGKDSKIVTEQSTEGGHGKTAVLHLKSTPTKEKPSLANEEETPKVRLIARVPHRTSEEESEKSKPKKEHDTSGLFSFWRTKDKRKGKDLRDGSEHPTLHKYEGPLDNVHRQRDIDQIPFKAPAVVPYKPAGSHEPSSQHRSYLFGRLRHEGDEEVVDKERIRPETYGVATTSYDGPLESTTRRSDLPSTPLREHSKAYHHGQSWDDSKGMKFTVDASDVNRGKAGVVHLKTAAEKDRQSATEEETPKVRLIARVPHTTVEDEEERTKAAKENESQRLLASARSKDSKVTKEPRVDDTQHPSTYKYAGQLDDVHRQKDISQIPLQTSAAAHYKAIVDDEPSHRRTNLFGRWRHEGDEETVEKDRVRPESYGIASTSYKGPLERTQRTSDLPMATLRDHAKAYHHGQSWDAGKDSKMVTEQSTEGGHGKTAVLHLKSTPSKEKPSLATEEETPKVRLIARVPHRTSEEESEKSKPKKEHDTSGLFSFWRTKDKRKGKDLRDGSEHPTLHKYEGPLDNVHRQRDIDQIPFKAPAVVPYKPAGSHEPSSQHRSYLFGRLRHEGDEEFVDKERIRPETYGVATTSYDGPLESTTRRSDLPSTPLREHSKAYHHGQSWDDSKGMKFTVDASDVNRGKAGVVHLKTAAEKDRQSATEEETPKVRLIARVPHTTVEDEEERTKAAKENESQRLLASARSKDSKVTKEPRVDDTQHPSTYKYAGQLDDVHRQKDISQIPLQTSAAAHYKAIVDDEPSHRRTNLFGRWRHEGDEETVEKDRVRPESYGIASTSYKGPLERTQRTSDLPMATLRDHAKAYHHGQSWDAGKDSKIVTEQSTEGGHGKTAVLHLKSTPTKEKPSLATEEETPKVRLIARVPHRTSEEESEKSKPKKEHDTSGLFSFWRTKDKRKGKDLRDGSEHPTLHKYEGPLDNVHRQRDIDQIPFRAPAVVPYKPAGSHEPSSQHRSYLFGRLRHEGDEEVVDKERIRPETYGVATTSYDGPLESTTRRSDLPSTPLREHSKACHHGQSWDDSKGMKFTVEASDVNRGKAGVVHLKTAAEKDRQSATEEETPKVRLIARVPHTTVEDEEERTKAAKENESQRLLASARSKDSKVTKEPRVDDTQNPSTYKYAGQLDDVHRQKDISQIPLQTSAAAHYKAIVDDEPSHRRTNLFGRWRHEGDEETVEKDRVRPESYGIASTSYKGPLERTQRTSDLPMATLRDHAKAYHHGLSWDASRDYEMVRGQPTEGGHGKTAVLHPKSAHTIGKSLLAEGEYSESQSEVCVPICPSKDNPERLEFDYGRYPLESSYATVSSGKGHASDTFTCSVHLSTDSSAASSSGWNQTRLLGSEPCKQHSLLLEKSRHGSDVAVVDDSNFRAVADDITSASSSGVRRHDITSDASIVSLRDYSTTYRRNGTIDDNLASDERQRSRAIGLDAIHSDSTCWTHASSAGGTVGHLETTPSSSWKGTPISQLHGGSDKFVAFSNSQCGRSEGRTKSGDEWVEVRVDRRVEVQLEPTFCLTEAGLRALSEDEDGMVFTVTPPMPSTNRSLFTRLGFKSSSKKTKKQKKGAKEVDSSDSSSSSDDEKNQVHVIPVESGGVTLPHYVDPDEKDGRVVRRETNELKYRLKGEGISPGFDPQNPSLASTMAEAERLNLRSPRLEHAERTVTVRALAPLPLSYEESGQPHTTISTWQESSRLPDEVTTEYDEKGNKITRTLKTSQVKHTVQKQTFQNYVVPTDGQPGIISVERTREETTPLGTSIVATNGSTPHVVETHSRSVAYDAGHNEQQNEGLGEFVSCKTLTSGNRTVETYTYKTERDGIIETHVEHRVTIHSDEPIDHDAELSHAIMEATQMNPDMTVEKIEVRQETTA